MFDFDAKREDDDVDLSNIEAADYDVMVAEEAILDWLVNLESSDIDYELAETDEHLRGRATFAN